MWARARYVALLLLLPAEPILAASGPVVRGDLFAICMETTSHSKATDGNISCGAGNVPAYYNGARFTGDGNFALEFQSHPEDGDYEYGISIRCQASQSHSVTKTVTITATTTLQPVTITKKEDPSISTVTVISKTDCNDSHVTPRPPTPSPEPTRFCATGRPYCWNEREKAESSADCADGYRMQGCHCRNLFQGDIRRPQCNDVGTVRCANCH
ncbi:hypothetical protein N7465_000123 [Penicillium sp. CMV-2018d]|nr:hypothetical protein N7465_000123 [Penicillium sp. CMV-2018d]